MSVVMVDPAGIEITIDVDSLFIDTTSYTRLQDVLCMYNDSD